MLALKSNPFFYHFSAKLLAENYYFIGYLFPLGGLMVERSFRVRVRSGQIDTYCLSGNVHHLRTRGGLVNSE